MPLSVVVKECYLICIFNIHQVINFRKNSLRLLLFSCYKSVKNFFEVKCILACKFILYKPSHQNVPVCVAIFVRVVY